MNKKTKVLTLLSGKGGSGKTVLALSISKILHEAGLKVLLVDYDTATHGATYFFETELHDKVLTLLDLLSQRNYQNKPLKTKSGFDFIPSTSKPELSNFTGNEPELESPGNFLFSSLLGDYDIIILDCQAGYTKLVKAATELSHYKLIVLEPDAVSSSALRVLHLQIGASLGRTNTWQIFNKLTEDERPIFEKVYGGTLFTNLPPVPFDWQVRAAFATAEIPSVISKTSAFGLGVIRSLKIIFKNYKNQLDTLEEQTVGCWHEDLIKKMNELAIKKKEFENTLATSRQKDRLSKARILSTLISILGLSIAALSIYGINIEFFIPLAGLSLVTISLFWYSSNLKEVRSERFREKQKESIDKIEFEFQKFKTLMLTDPWLKEYARNREMNFEEYDESLDSNL